MAKELGNIEKVAIRNIWSREPEFSKWLAEEENLQKLGDLIGIDMVTEEIEADVGDFHADIVAKEAGYEDRRIIIENQYEQTNHDHLGKIITYAAGKDAKVLIWIVEEGRDEHRAAIQWLNKNLNDDISAFLVKIEIIRIDDSKPAITFTILEQPNNWARMESSKAKTQLTPTESLHQSFWDEFQTYALDESRDLKTYFRRKASPVRKYFHFSLGSSKCQLSLDLSSKDNWIKAGVIIYPKDDDLFEQLRLQKDEIERRLDFPMKWESDPEKNYCRIYIQKEVDIKERESWSETFEWLYSKTLAIKKTFPDFLRLIQ